jgi:hypothetical protein
MYRTSTGTLGTIPIGSVDRAPFLLLWPLARGSRADLEGCCEHCESVRPPLTAQCMEAFPWNGGFSL